MWRTWLLHAKRDSAGVARLCQFLYQASQNELSRADLNGRVTLRLRLSRVLNRASIRNLVSLSNVLVLIL